MKCAIWACLIVLLSLQLVQGRKVFQGVVSSLFSTAVRGENVSDAPHYSSKNAFVPTTSHPLPSQQQQPLPQQQHSIYPDQFSPASRAQSSSLSRSTSFEPFPIFRSVKRKLQQQKLLRTYLQTTRKLFNKYKFKAFAITLIKSITDWNAAGVGVKIPITPSFPNYDSIIYLPRVVATLSLNYPFCWKLGFTINVPMQVYMMLFAMAFEYANQVYQLVKRVNALLGRNADGAENGGPAEGEGEEDLDSISSFSDRDPSRSTAPASASSPSAAKKPGAVKASGSVNRLGVTIGYKYTSWNAKGNGWSLGPALNYVSSLIITNKLLPFMILISVCFFSALETAFLLMYWMYEIYYFFVQQFVAVVNALWEAVRPVETTAATPVAPSEPVVAETATASAGAASYGYYIESPYYTKPSSPSPRVRVFQTLGGNSPQTDFFINSNNDLSIFSDNGAFEEENYYASTSVVADSNSVLGGVEPVMNEPPPAVAPASPSNQSNKPKKMRLSNLILNMKQRYHHYAQSKLHSQLLSPDRRSFGSGSSTLWQINWRKIEKWMLTKSPVFGYSASSAMLPYPKNGLKLAANVNFDIQNFHPVEYFQKIFDSIDFEQSAASEQSVSKNAFL